MEQVPENPILQLLERKQILNWAIAIQLGLGMFAGEWMRIHLLEPHWWTAVVPLALCVWAIWMAVQGFKQSAGGLPMHRRLDPSDYYRLFFVFGVSCWLLTTHKGGFWIYTLMALGMGCWLVMVLFTEIIQGPQRLFPLVLGCGFFLFWLARWEHSAFIRHYGVPMIGHFLESREYDARYYVKVGWRDAEPTGRAIADLHVRWKSEEVDTDEDRFRDVHLHNLHLTGYRNQETNVPERDGADCGAV